MDLTVQVEKKKNLVFIKKKGAESFKDAHSSWLEQCLDGNL